MSSRSMLVFAAISGFVFVALGAFGAHVLSGTLGANEMAGSAPGWNIRDSTPRPSTALAVAMQRRVSLWFYWSGALLAFGTVRCSAAASIASGAVAPEGLFISRRLAACAS